MSEPLNDATATGGDNGTTQNENTQTGTANISTSENSNIDSPGESEVAEAWRGNPKYFQAGKKAGQLKPAFRQAGDTTKKPREVSGVDAEKTAATTFKGLDKDSLRGATRPASSAPQADKKQLKAEKKLADAKTGAKIAMRVLDLLCGFIGGDEFGRGWTPEETKRRNEYRDTLEQDWETYLQTVDLPMHPGLIVALGSTTYVAEAFKTEKAQKRVAGWKEKLGGFIFKKML